MATYTALYDANVLYPSLLRDLLVRLAVTHLFRARWTARIHEEWIRNLLENCPDLTRERLERPRALMDAAVPDCLVENYESLIPMLALPDEDDRHVLVAAIRRGADVIVTFNLDDFPADALTPFDVEAQHSDEFVRHLVDLDRPAVLGVLRALRRGLKNPSYGEHELLDALEHLGLAQTTATLRPFAAIL